MKDVRCHSFYRFFFLTSSLTEENALDLERVQKAAIRLILGERYETYEDGLLRANLRVSERKKRKIVQNLCN